MQQVQTLNKDIIQGLSKSINIDVSLDDYSKLEYIPTNFSSNKINNKKVYATKSAHNILLKWKANASTKAIVLPTPCEQGDCDESSPNWQDQVPLHRECLVDISQKKLISTCTNHLITALMYNNQINYQGQHIKIKNSLNKYIGKGAFSRSKLSRGQVIAIYHGIYSLKSESLFDTGFSLGIKVCPELQQVIDSENGIANDQLIINAEYNHSLAKYFNSSCFSSCCHFIQTFVQGIPYVAIALTQDVQEDTELYLDYGESMLKKIGFCNCQQYNCRLPKYPYKMKFDNIKNLDQILEFNLFYLAKFQNIAINTYKINLLSNGSLSIENTMKLIHQLQRISQCSDQIKIYNQQRFDIYHSDLKLPKTANEFSSDTEKQQAKLYDKEQQCIAEKQQIIQNLNYVVLPFRLAEGKYFDINRNRLIVYIAQYPHSRCFKKYNTIEYSLLFNILSLKCQIHTPYYFTYRTISSQQFLINLVRFVQLSITECQLIVTYFYDTVITQCINEYLGKLASSEYFSVDFFKLQSRQSYNHKLVEPIYIQALLQAKQLVQKIIKPSILEKLKEYKHEDYSQEEFISSILQFKHQQSDIQLKWSYLNCNKYLNDFNQNETFIKIIEYYVKNPFKQNSVLVELSYIQNIQQIDKVMENLLNKVKSSK
ncbi:SET_domain [Hexamita inflata]|uniref:SET domain n=1 Tax=Hexamita inflata TaxID=28002 RepID=A0AA86TD52_9EUKA|nr:SET domain [Hexamita inflata]